MPFFGDSHSSTNPIPSLSDNGLLSPPPSTSLKRQIADTAAAIPIKRQCTKSSIRSALEQGDSGILQYFRKATAEEHDKHQKQMAEEIEQRAEEDNLHAKQEACRAMMVKRRKDTEWKRLQRTRQKKEEILNGLRSPGGSKQRVWIVNSENQFSKAYGFAFQFRNAKLQEPSTLDQGGSVAELSHPLRGLQKRLKEKRRKPQGRKALHQPGSAKHHNWFSPFLFKQIDDARIRAGGPTWSTVAIVKELQKQDYTTFQFLSRTTINEWIDRSGSTPRWSDRALERIRHGNNADNPNAGRKGVLVSRLIKYMIGFDSQNQ